VAAFLAYLMDPLLSLLRRLRVPLLLGVLLCGVLFLGVFLVLGYVLYQSGLHFAGQFPRYQAGFLNLVRGLVDWIETSTGIGRLQPLEELRKLPLGTTLLSAAGSVFSFLGDFGLVFLFSLLFLVGKYGFTRKLVRSFPRRSARRIAALLIQIDRDLRKYIGVKSFVSLLAGLGTGLCLSLFRVEFAVIFGFLAFVLNFIPYLGPILAVILPFLIALIQFASWAQPLWLLVILTLMHNLIGALLEPKLVGLRLNLSFPVIFLVLFFWDWLWGIPGILLAVPLTTALKIIAADVPALHPFALLLERAPRRKRGS
jgi:predicted PurR-regulated permease PerM